MRFFGSSRQRFHSSLLEMISVAPMKPGTSSWAGIGYSPKLPIDPANSSRCSPRAGSSGITIRRCGVMETKPTASARLISTGQLPGWLAAVWSLT